MSVLNVHFNEGRHKPGVAARYELQFRRHGCDADVVELAWTVNVPAGNASGEVDTSLMAAVASSGERKGKKKKKKKKATKSQGKGEEQEDEEEEEESSVARARPKRR